MNVAVDAANGGRVIASSPAGEPAWPTEQHAQARIVDRVIATLLSGSLANYFNPEEYRVPIEFPLGDKVTVGRNHMGGQAPLPRRSFRTTRSCRASSSFRPRTQ